MECPVTGPHPAALGNGSRGFQLRQLPVLTDNDSGEGERAWQRQLSGSDLKNSYPDEAYQEPLKCSRGSLDFGVKNSARQVLSGPTFCSVLGWRECPGVTIGYLC